MTRPQESRMSKYYRMCGSKKKFRTFAEAEQNGSRVYKCQFCDGFHRTQIKPQPPTSGRAAGVT